MNIKTMLQFVLAGLVKLNDEDRIRWEGNTVYQEIKAELIAAITAVDGLVAPVAPVVLEVMTADQVAALVDASNARISAAERILEEAITARTGQAVDAIVSAVRGDIEASDVVVLSAVADTRGDLLAAINPPA